jgi:predicted negative regulator of RcsB-dependent stress response
VAELRTEEEQVQALKAWWDENGKSLLLGIAVALAAVMGWKAWQQQESVQAENASILYQNLLDSVVGAIGPQQNEAKLATANHLNGQLKADYEGSAYANYAALIMARVAVDQNELDKALVELDWVLANQPTESMYALASIRKVKVIAAQGDLDKALSLVDAIPVAGYEVSLNELKGDLFLAKGEKAKARAAYKMALDATDSTSRPLLDMKLNDLAATEG